MSKIIISGYLDLNKKEFEEHYQASIDEALECKESFVVGDARGADTLTQNYLFGKTEAVIVYHMFTSPRNNAGFTTVGGFKTNKARNEQMTRDSDQDIAWVYLGQQSSGTQKNINHRIELGKIKNTHNNTLRCNKNVFIIS